MPNELKPTLHVQRVKGFHHGDFRACIRDHNRLQDPLLGARNHRVRWHLDDRGGGVDKLDHLVGRGDCIAGIGQRERPRQSTAAAERKSASLCQLVSQTAAIVESSRLEVGGLAAFHGG